MAEMLQHQSSLPFGKEFKGCSWDFLQFFNFYRRLHIRMDDGGRRPGGLKVPGSYAPLCGNEHDTLDSEADSEVTNKSNTLKRNFLKAWMRALISKRLYRKQNQKQKMLPVAPRLLRTISIHYLECDDYVLPNEMASQSETPTVDINSDGTKSCESSDVQMFSRGMDRPNSGKICDVCSDMNTINVENHVGYDQLGENLEKQATLFKHLENLSKKKRTDQEQGRDAIKDFVNMMELFSTQKDLFLEVLEDPNICWENYLGLHSSEIRALTKSGSFPGTGFLGTPKSLSSRSRLRHKWKGSDLLVHQEEKSLVRSSSSTEKFAGFLAIQPESVVDIDTDLYDPEPSIKNNDTTDPISEYFPQSHCELEGQKDHDVLNRLNILKQRIMDVINERKKEHHRISMDGMLHRIPYGQNVSEDVQKEKLFRSASATYIRDSSRQKIGGSVNRYPHQSINRSHSLSETLDRYSRLLESKKLSGSLRSNKDSSSLELTPNIFQRIYSSPEFRSSSLNGVAPIELLHEALSSKIPVTDALDSDVIIHSSDEAKSLGFVVHTEERTESNICEGHAVDLNARGVIQDLEQSVLTNEHCHRTTYKISESTGENASSVPLHEQESEPLEKVVLTCEENQNKVWVDSDPKEEGTTCTPSYEQEMQVKANPSSEATKTGPISTLDSEEPVSSAKYTNLEGSELELGSSHFNELDIFPNPQKLLGVKPSCGMEIIEPNFGNIESEGLANHDRLQFQVNQKSEAELSYAKDVSENYGFNREGFFGALYSLNQAGFGEANDLPYELDITKLNSNSVPLDQELLFDLTNELLYETYENYCSHSPWFSNFVFHISSKFVESRVLKEVQMKIHLHLSSQDQSSNLFEDVVARDFAKNDRWLNLHCDVEFVGMELEALMLDDLLDELSLELGKCSSV
ncbi:uncharacterized protein [Typha latifolia]|uniref:uncharacterized protein n=1 Tax=Typha latifolia TaxID=4733 RepID=UPI003C2F2C57